jgi:hypothetical protein
MDYVMVSVDDPANPIRYYDTERGAKIGVAAANRKYGGERFYRYITERERQQADTMVTVINLMSGEPVEIRKSVVGTVCDPSTNKYWEM